MKRVAVMVAAVVFAAALAILTTRPGPQTATSSATLTEATAMVAAPAPRISRAEIDGQHDQVTAAERGRIGRTRLLNATLVTAVQAHGLSITTGDARSRDRARQDMVVTPAPDLTVREISDGISRICAQLDDPCRRRDYRFVIQTPTGQAVMPARLLDPKDRTPMPPSPALTSKALNGGAE